MNVEQGAYTLLIVVAIGIALVILTGVGYTNYINTKGNLVTQYGTSASNNAIIANFTTNGGNITNTAGSNANYVYYILFMALVIAVVIGALVGAVRHNSKG
jgi:hypothetical protein